ncbi:MAG TPA: hypothetical protein VHW46_02490 [Terracidiphilus sp.]|nr:hypothetical protein [Terracidiphilus sp.]
MNDVAAVTVEESSGAYDALETPVLRRKRDCRERAFEEGIEMEIGDLIGTTVDSKSVSDQATDSSASLDPRDLSKRAFLRAAGVMIAGLLLPEVGKGAASLDRAGTEQKVVLVLIGGVRRAETFAREGLANIPHLVGLFPQSLFYVHARNEGVTAHFNAISSILTGNWQRVDDWGKLAPTTPTLFEQLRKGMHVDRRDTWVVASNKALTSLIGASSDAGYGPAYGANVVFPKQLMLQAIEDARRAGRTENLADRSKVEAELERALEGSNYEGLGWNVFDAAEHLDVDAEASIRAAITTFVRSGGPTSGDELTFFVAREIMRKFAPKVLVAVFSDVEAAHFGSYSMHVSGIQTADRLAYQLWQEIETNPAYKGRTTLCILPEFGRDPDGSSTNGFFNHRANDDTTRDTWMMALGSAVGSPQVIERPIRHVDLCPTLTMLLGCRPLEMQGTQLGELRA